MAAPGFYENREAAKHVIDRHQALMWEVGDLMAQWEALQEHAAEQAPLPNRKCTDYDFRTYELTASVISTVTSRHDLTHLVVSTYSELLQLGHVVCPLRRLAGSMPILAPVRRADRRRRPAAIHRCPASGRKRRGRSVTPTTRSSGTSSSGMRNGVLAITRDGTRRR